MSQPPTRPGYEPNPSKQGWPCDHTNHTSQPYSLDDPPSATFRPSSSSPCPSRHHPRIHQARSKGTIVQRSTGRILTTHAGSLIRPDRKSVV